MLQHPPAGPEVPAVLSPEELAVVERKVREAYERGLAEGEARVLAGLRALGPFRRLCLPKCSIASGAPPAGFSAGFALASGS